MISYILSILQPFVASFTTIFLAAMIALILNFLLPTFQDWTRYALLLIVLSSVLLPAFQHFLYIQEITATLSSLFIAVYPMITASILAAGSTFNLLNFQPAMLLFANGAIYFADRLLIPLLAMAMLLDVSSRMLPEVSFKRLSEFIRTSLLGIVSAIVAAYSIFITAGGTMSWALSGTVSEPIKELISQNIPIIGSFMTESISSIGKYSSGASLLISSWLLITIWSVSIIPTVKTLLTALAYRWMAAIIEPFVDESITGLLDDIGKTLFVLCALSFLIAFAFIYTAVFVMAFVKLLTAVS